MIAVPFRYSGSSPRTQELEENNSSVFRYSGNSPRTVHGARISVTEVERSSGCYHHLQIVLLIVLW